MWSSKRRLNHRDYTVGWISALPLEMAAAKAMLDDSHSPLPIPESDHNSYHLGEIEDHNIVVACLPTGVYGHTSAAVVATQMLSTFPAIKFGLLVGIGGGVPSDTADIRLGDIVVSKPSDKLGGVVQYDYGKSLANGVFHRTGTLNKPPQVLLTAISNLQSDHMMEPNRVAKLLKDAVKSFPLLKPSFSYPGSHEDILFERSYKHNEKNPTCTRCDPERRVLRSPRQSTVPHIHYGIIASANQVMKDAELRDRWGRELGVLCYEMEAAGLMDHFPCLVIRGICDYADSHKNKKWQNYAAATAAAYAKELLQNSIPSTVPSQESAPRIKIKMKIPVVKTVFFGREQELNQMQHYLNFEKAGQEAIVIWGLSGYGKTQLGIHYLTLHKERYNSVLWIDGSSEPIISDSFEQIASLIPSSWHENLPAVDRVLQWLEQSSNQSWIMVFDGIQNIDETDCVDELDIRKYLPSCDHGHLVLITTASDLHLRLRFPDIQLEGVDNQTGSSILLRCAGGDKLDYSVQSVAMEISRKIGGVPLALEQAGSFLSYGLIPIKEYNTKFQARYLDATLKTPVRKYVGSYEKGRTLWTVFDMLYNALSERSPESIKLLHLVVFLGPGQLPFTILSNSTADEAVFTRLEDSLSSNIAEAPSTNLITLLKRLRTPTFDIFSIMQDLEASGLVRISRGSLDTLIETISIHDLVRYFVRSKVSEDDAQESLAMAFLLNGMACYDSHGIYNENFQRAHMGRLSSVLNDFLTAIPQKSVQPPDGKYFRFAGPVAPLYAKICRFKGQLESAEYLWEIALQYRFISEGERWPKDTQELEELSEAADIDSKLGKLEDAIEKYSLVLTRCEALILDGDQTMIHAAASLRKLRERKSRQEKCFVRATVATQSSIKPSPEVQNGNEELDNEEWMLVTRYEDALNFFGPDDVYTLRHARDLAIYYMKRGQTQDEERYREVIWNSDVSRFGYSHYKTLFSLDQLCLCYHKNDRLREKLQDELYSAPTWTSQASSKTSGLLLEAQKPDILEALENGEQNSVRQILDRYNSLHVFCWAASIQDFAVRDVILFSYFTNGDIFNGNTLFELIRLHEDAAVKLLLERGVNASCIRFANGDTRGPTALHHAAGLGAESIARILLEGGANVSLKDYTGRTPLHYAVYGRSELIVRIIIEHGAEISSVDDMGWTALHNAAFFNYDDMIGVLLDLGSDIASKEKKYGDTPLHTATRGRRMKAVECLLKAGGGIFEENRDGYTAMELALCLRFARLATLISKYSSHSRDSSGRTLMHRIVQKELPLFICEFSREPDFIDAIDRQGRTALHYAVDAANLTAVRMLLDNGANREIRDSNGCTALDTAITSSKKITQRWKILVGRKPLKSSLIVKLLRDPIDLASNSGLIWTEDPNKMYEI